ncbi:MAG: hypothetical protein ACTHJ3_07395 [Pararhizobium sp.]
MKRALVFASLATMTIALGGCETAGYAPAPMRPQPAGIEGNWIDQNGIMSSFRNGTFETRTTDTNSVLATGSYTQTAGNVVQINMHSILRNTDSTVNCAEINPTQLNCTSSSGAHFSLNRAGRAG